MNNASQNSEISLNNNKIRFNQAKKQPKNRSSNTIFIFLHFQIHTYTRQIEKNVLILLQLVVLHIIIIIIIA